jgi:uncharacterized protein (TIGR00730 family)
MKEDLEEKLIGSNVVSLNDAEATLQVVKEAVIQLWDVINGLTSLRPPKRKRYRVTIFGSARIEKNSSLYEEVKWLASQLTEMGCDIVTGGGPGLMEAANEGSVISDPSDRTQSIGIRVNLATEQEVNPFVEQTFRHRTFFSRLHQFVLISNAFVVVPGGIGTTLEAFMIWQLLQVRHLDNTPLIMIGEMWFELVGWAKKYMLEGEFPLVNPDDILIPYCVDSVKEAMTILQKSQGEWENLSS